MGLLTQAKILQQKLCTPMKAQCKALKKNPEDNKMKRCATNDLMCWGMSLIHI